MFVSTTIFQYFISTYPYHGWSVFSDRHGIPFATLSQVREVPSASNPHTVRIIKQPPYMNVFAFPAFHIQQVSDDCGKAPVFRQPEGVAIAMTSRGAARRVATRRRDFPRNDGGSSSNQATAKGDVSRVKCEPNRGRVHSKPRLNLKWPRF